MARVLSVRRPGWWLAGSSVVLAVVLAGSLAWAGASASAAEVGAEPCVGADCDVVTDPDSAAYVGSGGLLLPSQSFTGSADDRAVAATCDGCRWALALFCRGDDVPCGPIARSCPADQIRYIVLLWRPADPQWRQVGFVCMSRGGPTTVADVADLLRDRVVEDVPPLVPSMQPSDRTLVQLPTIFAAGQPASLGDRQFDLVGFEIVLSGRATWNWAFGDGSALTTQEPGGRWPDTSVAHVYERPGQFSVAVSSTWEAWFTVDGMGPFAVGGEPVVQNATPIPIDVVAARAELVAN